jgi:HTH-type transcriptional regulator/antitoxin HigA
MIDPLHRTPGQLIQSLLELKGWTQQVLCIVLDVDRSIISKIIAGKRALDAEMALGLAEVFGIPAEVFMELQQKYDLAQAQITAIPDPGRATRAKLFGDLPISEMIKRGWLPSVSDIREVGKIEEALKQFFQAASVEEIEVLPHAAKKTHTTSECTPVQLAWLYRVREIAEEILVSKYSETAVQAALKKLESLRASTEDVRKVPRILSDCGIRFVIVETLPGAHIDGVCTWLNGSSPVIGMTLRFDRIDNFWFVLRHEMEHVIRGHGKEAAIIDAELEGEKAGCGEAIPDEERIANQAAAEFCAPKAMMDAFISRKAPVFAERDIVGLARMLKVHPGLVVGQLQRRTGRYDRFRQHLAKVRDCIKPSAVVDGWGDVAQVGDY